MSVTTFDEVTKTTPEKSLLEPIEEEGRPQRQRADHDPAPGRRPQAPLPHGRLQAPQGRHSGQGGGDRVRPQPLGPDRAPALRRRRQGLHPRSGRPDRGSAVESGPSADIKPGNALPIANIPTGTMLHNVELQPGKGGQIARSAGAERAAGRQGRSLRRAASALGRDAPRTAHLPGHDRPGRECRSLEHHRSARRDAAAGAESARRCAARP